MGSNDPYGKTLTPKDIGRAIRAKRQIDGLRQAEAAALCGVGTRFLSEIENGKETAAIGKVLAVLRGLGLELGVTPRGSRR